MNYTNNINPLMNNHLNNLNSVKFTGSGFEFPGEAVTIMMYLAVLIIAAIRNPNPN